MSTYPTLHEIAAKLENASLSSVELTRQALSRMDDPAGEGAPVHIRRNDARAIKLAEASDATRQSGHRRSLLEGVTISVKDLFDLSGETTLAGSVALEGHAAATVDAHVVNRLIAAGAVITGTTNMSEFAFSGIGINPHYGTPLNPYDRATGRVPGGSSSGAAVSVTDAMAVAAIGTDTGGSIRIPAALCGLTGFKPTARRVSAQGVVPLSTSLDSIGPLAASVHCCAAIDAVISGSLEGLPGEIDIRGLRLAIPKTVVLSDMDETVSRVFARAVSALSAAGAVLSEIELPEFAEVADIYARGNMVAAEAYAWHRDLIAAKGAVYDPRVRARIVGGGEISAADYIRTLETRAAWKQRVLQKVEAFDALLMPTVPVIAPELKPLLESDAAFFAANGLILRNPTMINFLDGCALSLPAHDREEAPVGVMLAGTEMRDRHILSVGLAVERVLATIRQ